MVDAPHDHHAKTTIGEAPAAHLVLGENSQGLLRISVDADGVQQKELPLVQNFAGADPGSYFAIFALSILH